VAQPGFSFRWGTTRLSFAFFLPSPILLFPHILLPFTYPLTLPLPCRFPMPSLPSPKFSYGVWGSVVSSPSGSRRSRQTVSSALCAKIAASRDTNTKTDPVMDFTFLLQLDMFTLFIVRKNFVGARAPCATDLQEL